MAPLIVLIWMPEAWPLWLPGLSVVPVNVGGGGALQPSRKVRSSGHSQCLEVKPTLWFLGRPSSPSTLSG